ncbi:MAG: hypothetical protein ACI4PF_04150, partial [Christensenellales bacterium]
FYNFAMGDLYSQISQYSSISELTKVGGLTTQKVGNVQLIMPESIANGGYISRESNNSGDNKFDLCEITNSIKAYNVIPNNLGNNNEGFNGLSDGVGNNNVINENCIISGRSTEIGKVIITLSSNTNRLNTKHFVDTNNGVLSNVYLYTGNVDSVNNIALVKVNNGLITNVMVYGVSYANYTLTETNNGEIYSSVSSIKYMATSDTYTSELYGLVKTNNVTGIISDCYSNSFGYTESKDYITNVYGFAMTNYGNILNSTYFIPSSMEYDNVNCGFVKPLGEDASEEEKTKVDNSIIERCYQTAIPSNLLQRKSIWIEENNHCQIRGMKDIEGSIVTRIMIKIDGETEATEITSVKDLKDKITNNPGKYQLSYEYDFYVSADDMPEYTVVRVSRQSDLIDYISSLTNGYIPANTILLITNNFLSDNSESIKVDATKLNKISLNATSAIIGINTKNANNNITLDFNSSNASGQDVVQGIMEHELINVNNGLIAGITIANLEMKKINATARFATIATNNGTLDNVCFTKISVKGIGASFVAGMVSTNSTTGVINNCTIDVYVYSLTWVNRICTTNNGIINNTICTSISYDGDLYYGGV